ncbi:DUF5017 domain-containing protein [Sphingobacterium tabacisoli]|uniref:DUF5017 domain-containing protein n=1 Tax=Sphingobacterium tabacisoli TaxID=2044855 RepID=A0ABW5L0X7_9SPHI|nr:DUF5017 domain-containing protein [Sphingobacterium tabacisoli]
MNINKYIFFGLSVCLSVFSSCKRLEMEIEKPSFEVEVGQDEYNAGEPVLFKIASTADYINFYSGELFSDYAHKEGRVAEPGWENIVSFDSQITAGSQKDQLSILVSSDFNGDYNFDNIKSTAWTDVTNWFALATGNSIVSSGTQSLYPLSKDGRPLYFAFRYVTKFQSINGNASRWVVSNFKVQNKSVDAGDLEIINTNNAGFRLVDPFALTHVPSRTTVSKSQISMQGNFYGPDDNGVIQVEDIETEHWVVSKPFTLGEPFQLGPDKPISIKNYATAPVKEYSYTFENPGTYYVTFVASNQSQDNKQEIVRTLKVVVK